MRYFSTRDKSLDLSFKDIFFKGLSNDGGLFLPKNIPVLSETDLKKFQDYNFQEMSYEIFNLFTGVTFKKNDLKKIINDAYTTFRNEKIVDIKKIDHISFLQLYHGPTLAFKDIAMQVLGQMYNFLLKDSKKVINLITATSGDTGAAAIDAVQGKKSINIFVLHPHNKISSIQRKLMTTYEASNVFNIAIKGSFDDCQKIVKDMFVDQGFSNQINMSGVNSINWARIVCQIVYYFYSFFKLQKNNISYSVPTGNFGDIYAGYIAKKMGLPINKLIVATNKNDILNRVINTGEYKPDTVKPSITPSMDIQVASNFERLLFYILDENDSSVSSLMNELSSKGIFTLKKTEIEKIKKDFECIKITDEETEGIIHKIYKDHQFIVDPHTATGFGAANKIKNLGDIIVLGTAHPYKFNDTIKKAIGKNLEAPKHLKLDIDKKETFDIIENSNLEVKKYILSKI